MTTRDVVFPPGRHALCERHRYSPVRSQFEIKVIAKLPGVVAD